MVARRTKSKCATGTQPRQLPGPACEECRKRKLRCDRKRPTCGTCAQSGVQCDINTNRLARGPKKGDLKALRNRVVALERRLSLEQMQGQVLQEWSTVDEQPEEAQAPLPDLPSLCNTPGAATFGHYPSPSQSTCPPSWNDEVGVQIPPLTPTAIDPLTFATFAFPPTPQSPPKRSLVDDLMRADLDQIYFDRVHPNIPIFNQSKYFARTRQTCLAAEPNYMLCLQYAMWTVATALSSQFEELGKLLHKEARRMLEGFDDDDQDLDFVPVEQVQAWLLLAFYELARCNNRQAWTTAGRAFRLVQLARLSEVDIQEDSPPDYQDSVSREERRRTFWVAYFLDRLISIRNCCSLTLAEESIFTRLPSHENSFQSGQPIPSCFLSEAMAPSDHSLLPSFAESVILATVCGRALTHDRAASMDRAYTATSIEFWVRHNWVESMLTRIIEAVTANNPVALARTDPAVFFTLIMAHSIMIYMCQILESVAAVMDSQYQLTVMDYQSKAMSAATEIARHTKGHEQIGYFKAHIFLPWAISLAVSRLMRHPDQMMDGLQPLTPPGTYQTESESRFEGNTALMSCLDALRKMQSFNNLAKEHLSLLERQNFSLGCL